MNCPRLKDWLDERYDLEGVKRLAKGKLVPEHRYDLWYYTGGITLFLFILQFMTGMLMALYYVPHIDFAHKSIIEIVTKLNMGWFFRSCHHWGAQLAIVFLFIHLFGTLLLKSYRKPREFVWVTGFILLGISIFFGLSGYLLLWDERAFAAVRVATGGAGAFPVIGWFIKAFLRGSIDVTGDTLIRFYAFHVAILPIITLGLIGLHILLVQYHGMSVPLSLQQEKAAGDPLLPECLLQGPDDLAGRHGGSRDPGGVPAAGDRREGRSPGPAAGKHQARMVFSLPDADPEALPRRHPGAERGDDRHRAGLRCDPLFLSHPLFRQKIVAGARRARSSPGSA